MTRKIELLAPGGDLESIRAAIAGGADAIYCGLERFNARHRAANITLDDLGGVLAAAHRHGCRIFLTLNTVIVETDIPVVVAILNKLVNTSVDGVIVQDLGLLHLLSTHFPRLRAHASTQLTTHNEGQLRFLRRLGATRVNLSRELDLDEIARLTRAGHEEGLSIEVFVHGSYCLCFSGLCYLSSIHGGNSGNRGRCSQPCRDRHLATPRGSQFPLNLKDNSAYLDLERLADAGVDAMKIEGRMKKFHYVYTVTRTYSSKLDRLHRGDEVVDESAELRKVFNRDYSSAYLTGELGPEMFSDHPRLRAVSAPPDPRYVSAIEERIAHVRIEKAPLTVRVSGGPGTRLEVAVQTPDDSFVVSSEARLAPRRSDSTVPPLDAACFRQRLRAVDETECFIDRLDVDELQPGLFLPRSELTRINQRILSLLARPRVPVAPVAAPVLAARGEERLVPRLSVLIDDVEDLRLGDESSAEIHFQLPSDLKDGWDERAELLRRNRRLVPWFPPVLIGEDYAAAVRLLRETRPARIVTNNTGVAHEACKEGIAWVAGPYLNTANSLSLLCLRERFACEGAFASGELSRHQLRRLNPPEGLELHYAIFQPILLLTSRLCLFHQVTGCDKGAFDEACLERCQRSATITNLKGAPLLIRKTRGSYCSIYHPKMLLNTEVAGELPHLFSSFLIDLREVGTETQTTLDKPSLIRLFEAHLQGRADARQQLERSIGPTTTARYQKGI